MNNIPRIEDPDDNFEVSDLRRNMIWIGESISRQILELQNTISSELELCYFFDKRISVFTPQEAYDAITKIKSDMWQSVDILKGKSNDQTSIDKIAEYINQWSFEAKLHTYGRIRLEREIDNLLLRIANDETISIDTKRKFFELIEALLDKKRDSQGLEELKKFNSYPNEIVEEDSVWISTGNILPVNYNYVLNPSNVEKRILRLRKLKQFITKFFARSNIVKYSEGEEEKIDQIIDEYIPGSNIGSVEELMTILNQEKEYVSDNERRRAFLQLYRIYREYINTLIASSLDSNQIIREQENNLSSTEDTRVGLNNTVTRNRYSRRIDLFNNQHVGTVPANLLSPDLPEDSRVPIPQPLINLFENSETALISKSGENIELDSATDEKIQALKQRIDERISPSTAEAIVRLALSKLGILSPEQIEILQVDAKIKGKVDTQIKDVKTFAVEAKENSQTFAINTKYRVFVMPYNKDFALYKLLMTISHEIGHIGQRLAKDNSNIPGLELLGGLGRSGIFAEAGAIKVERIMQNFLEIDKKSYNLYHFAAIKAFSEGKTYWEIFNIIFSMIYNNKIIDGETISLSDIQKSTFRTLDRVYSHLGAKGDIGGSSKMPTNTTFLEYIYQGMPEFGAGAYYQSGIPAHREELMSLIGEPIINGKKVMEADIIKAVIEAAYEVLT